MQINSKHVVNFALVALVFFLPWVSQSYGVTWDEVYHHKYAGLVLRYFESGFKDQEALTYFNMRFYGGMFDLSVALAQKALPDVFPFSVRHAVNSLYGWIGLLYTARVGTLLGGWRVGLLSLVLLLISPVYFGHMMNNPKDIPFASFYIMTVFYLIRFTMTLPHVSWRTYVGCVAGAALAINSRAGGVLLLFYWVVILSAYSLALSSREKQRSLNTWWITGFGILFSLLAGTAFWPWAQRSPFLHLYEAIAAFSQFPWDRLVLFDGELIPARQLPSYYGVFYLAITTPFIVFLGSAFGLLDFVAHTGRRRLYLLPFAMTTMPLGYIALLRPVLYDGVRHLLFICPLLCVIAGLGMDSFFSMLNSKHISPLKKNFGICLGLALALEPVWFSIRAHPYQSVYYNQLVGGPRGAFRRYELDYWGNCSKEVAEWLADQASILGRPIRFMADTWNGGDVFEAASLAHSGVRRVFDESAQPDYLVELMRFLPAESLDAKTSSQSVRRAINVDGATLCLVSNPWSS